MNKCLVAVLFSFLLFAGCGGSPAAPGAQAPAPVPTVSSVSLASPGQIPDGTTTTYGFSIFVTVNYTAAPPDGPDVRNLLWACAQVDPDTILSGNCTGQPAPDITGSLQANTGLASTYSHDNPFGGIITQTNYLVLYLTKGDLATGRVIVKNVIPKTIHYK